MYLKHLVRGQFVHALHMGLRYELGFGLLNVHSLAPGSICKLDLLTGIVVNLGSHNLWLIGLYNYLEPFLTMTASGEKYKISINGIYIVSKVTLYLYAIDGLWNMNSRSCLLDL